MPAKGFKTITVKEEVYGKLVELSEYENIKVAETLPFLIENYRKYQQLKQELYGKHKAVNKNYRKSTGLTSFLES